MQTVKTKIQKSAVAFRDTVWPEISKFLGGGRIVAVESVVDRDFFNQYLDAYSGIDTWHVDDDKSRIRGLAIRVQRTKKLFESLTIRFQRQSGRDTEIHKRLAAINSPEQGWLCPSLIVHAYCHPVAQDEYGSLRAVAIARTADVIRIIANGNQGTSWRDTGDWYLDTTSMKWGNSDSTQFAVVPIETLRKQNIKHKWILYDHHNRDIQRGDD